MDTKKSAGELLKSLNEQLKEQGLLELGLISPKECIGQPKNARYFAPEKFKQLVTNIKKGGMESVPLVMRSLQVAGKYDVISGHHRVEAAREAGLEVILVFIADDNLSYDEIVSRQLSHNALVGLDDKTLLAELFQSIKSIECKIQTGLNDEIGKVSYESLNFKVGTWKEFTVLFLPEDEGLTDEMMEAIAASTLIKSSNAVRMVSIDYWDRFATAIRKIKKVENIKSNGTAFLRMVELAETVINQLQENENELHGRVQK
jgi:hypothetical protein